MAKEALEPYYDGSAVDPIAMRIARDPDFEDSQEKEQFDEICEHLHELHPDWSNEEVLNEGIDLGFFVVKNGMLYVAQIPPYQPV